MLPTTHSDIVTSLQDSFNNDGHILDLIPIADDFNNKQKIIKEYYNKIVIHKKMPNEKDCQSIITLTPYMNPETYNFFKKHHLTNGTEPDFKFVKSIIDIRHEESSIPSISAKDPKKVIFMKNHITVTFLSTPIALVLLLTEIALHANNNTLHWIDAPIIGEITISLINLIILGKLSIHETNTLSDFYKFSPKNVTNMLKKVKSAPYQSMPEDTKKVLSS